jgi:hypothetical protein
LSPGLSHDNSDLGSLSSFSPNFESLFDSEFMSPTHDTHPPGFPQTASSPDDSHPAGIPKTAPPPDDSHSGSSWLPDVSPPASLLGWPPKDPVPYSPGLWVPVDSISTSWSGSAQDHVPSPPNLGDDLASDNHRLPTSPSNPEPSTELPPSAKRPRPDWRSALRKMFKGKL